jgi:hypothetical protein
MSGNSQQYEKVCPGCGHTNVLRGRALTIALTCKKCGLYFCVHAKLQDKFLDKFGPAIPVGSRGTIDGKLYEVMAFTVKRELKYRYQWREYVLFNPHHGVVFLSEYNGNWNLLNPYPKHPWSYGLWDHLNNIRIDENDFQLYAKYKAEVLFASGEYFHDVIEQTQSSTYYEHICPPYLLTYETNLKSTSAYQGEYIAPEKVAQAFQLERNRLPAKDGKGYTEPQSQPFKESSLIGLTFFSLFIATIILIFFNERSTNREVISQHFEERNLDKQKMFTTPSFELTDGVKNLSVEVYAPLSNDWFFAEFSLINETTDDEYVFTNEIEYYSGFESGEHWSEGSTRGDAFLSSIPEGKYHINIYPEFSSYNHQFDITVYRDLPFYSNYWVTFLVISIFPIVYFIIRYQREVNRWRESDYSPYRSDDNDDE